MVKNKKIIITNSPQDAYDFQTYFEKIRDIYGKPDYAVGITFGVDLEKWRGILKILFGQEFREKRRFEKAHLFTDKVSMVDSNRRRDLIKDNLSYSIPKVKGFLHTKMILLKYDQEYVLLVLTKNLMGTASYDYIVPLTGCAASGEGSRNHGEKLVTYMEYLFSKAGLDESEKSRHIGMIDFENLRHCVFECAYEGWSLEDFQIAYDDQRFGGKLWNHILSSDQFVSPFLDVETIQSILACRKSQTVFQSKISSVKILAYPDHIQKVKKECEDTSGIEFFMGKIREEKGYVTQNRFHAKIYFRENDQDYSIILGSANLTGMAKETHCEMLIHLKTKDVHNYKKVQSLFDMKNGLIEQYNEGTALPVDYDEEDDREEGDFCGVLGSRDSIYVKKSENKFELHVVKGTGEDVLWGMPYDHAVYYVVYFDKMLRVDPSIYLEDTQVVHYQDAYTFLQYEALVKQYLLQFQRENDLAVLQGRILPAYPSQSKGDTRNSGGKVREEIPCLYSTIDSLLEEKRRKNKSDTISRAQLLEILKELKEKMYLQSNIHVVQNMIDQLEKTDGAK